MSKHFVTDPKTLVKDSLQGFVLANPHLAFDENEKVVYTRDLAAVRSNQVTMFCGGGSGHEPAHAGYVGHGMLSASVSGHVFASPSSSQVLSCLRRVYSEKKGTLVVIKNYTGDVLNFGRAVERFKSEHVNQGKPVPKVAMVVVGDDVGVLNESADEGGVGQRGLAGTVLVYKLAGACAADGGSLQAVQQVAEYVANHTFSIGCALNAASIPGQGFPRTLQDDEIEVGMGIHNEPGFEKRKLDPANVLVKNLVDHIVASPRFTACKEDKSRVVVFVNNLGATSNLEMGLVTKLAVESVKAQGIRVERVFSGTYMTALAMPGASISVLVLPREESKAQDLLSLIDAPAHCPGWINHAKVVDAGSTDESAKGPSQPYTPAKDARWEHVIETVYKNVVINEPEVTRLDQIMGDGDCGQVLLSGVSAIHDASKKSDLPLNDPSAALARMSAILEGAMGGTSGIIYCLFMDGLAQSMSKVKGSTALSPAVWGEAMIQALHTLYQYTTARPGHRTLIDALEPFASTLAKTGDVDQALKAARAGAEATTQMKPKRGRAAYMGADHDKVQDAGAAGLVAVLEGIAQALHSNL
ncbi:Dihydroxyacetone kinase 2 [Actinomortierella ambigua]|nr:Dihydroxyacetone kinase 2 [Actinomortierella ambigua]